MHLSGHTYNRNAIAALCAVSRHEGSRKRILIGMSNTGGGHKASAEAIKAAFEERYGDKYEVRRITLMRWGVLAWGAVGMRGQEQRYG